MKRMRQPRKAAFFPGECRGKKSKAQSILEYAVLIACLVAALLAMQVYLKRSAQGRLRQLGDELGPQYAPRNTSGSSTVSYNSTSTTGVKTLSERQLNLEHPGANIDLNGDGDYEDDDVFATETLSTLDNSTTQQKGEEKVGPLESSLY